MNIDKPYIICPGCGKPFRIEPMKNRYLETECPHCALQTFVGAVYVSSTNPKRLQYIIEYTQKVSIPISQELAETEKSS